jgi:hypothetical protein
VIEAAIKVKVRRDEKWTLRSDADDPHPQTLLPQQSSGTRALSSQGDMGRPSLW